MCERDSMSDVTAGPGKGPEDQVDRPASRYGPASQVCLHVAQQGGSGLCKEEQKANGPLRLLLQSLPPLLCLCILRSRQAFDDARGHLCLLLLFGLCILILGGAGLDRIAGLRARAVTLKIKPVRSVSRSGSSPARRHVRRIRSV